MIAEVNINTENDLILIQEPSLVEIATYGIQGAKGNSLNSGYGLPAPSLGIELDLYLDLSNGYLYKKLTGAWVYQTYLFAQQKKFTITAQNILDKYILLTPTPSNSDNVTLEFVGGTEQENGVEFQVVGATLSWAIDLPNGVIGMEGFIAENDVIIVRY
jgi:hypothetical protein